MPQEFNTRVNYQNKGDSANLQLWHYSSSSNELHGIYLVHFQSRMLNFIELFELLTGNAAPKRQNKPHICM